MKVLPEQATTSKFLSVSNGPGVIISDKVYAFGGDITLQVGAPKFITQSLLIKPDDPSTIEVILEPSPGKLLLTTGLQSPDTNWFINDVLVHIGETLAESLKPGSYTVRVEDKYYEPLELEVKIESLEEVSQTLSLTEVQGLIEINSTPVGARVKINDEEVGVTPIKVEASSGHYDVEVETSGYELLTDSLALTYADANPTRSYLLEPKKGTLKVSAEPNNGTLIINGKAVQHGTIQLAANREHLVLYEKDGFFPFSSQIKLTPGQTKAFDIVLKPEIGDVTIIANPNADITIDGKLVGTGSYSGKLPAIAHSVEISKAGYRSVNRNLRPSSSRLSKIDVTLLTEFDTRRAEGKPLYVDTIGIDMARFRMTEFSLGSPANEKGRRRNEFEIPVKFSKQAWISRHEITQAQYRNFEPAADNSSLPITNVTWNDAALFCNWLSEQEGLPPFYINRAGTVVGVNEQSKGYRLPTEAEWEWLAKRSKRANSTVFPWGSHERIPKGTGNFADESVKGSQTFYLKQYNDGFVGTAPVGSFRADRAGLFDIAGNVSEWVHDYYSSRPPADGVKVDYLGATSGSGHVVKGGNYQSGRLAELRAAYRELADNASETIGFRIARYQ
ncbi:SUMF1/EgtB/PvdO family nonheme iron enzyme [Pseudoalteromonas sp. BMB]|uniref:SUMF1/EgtB/PvdO family nonheme iron enzyme n=1 Tax=Pseudoalteromonas sp. BMB TaxID=1874619 RepID=UPI001586C4A2|nr:SUMF1/EgtB/PvdO family nonheme iron enzyme [Pseudoalteromonas sp. BMB]